MLQVKSIDRLTKHLYIRMTKCGCVPDMLHAAASDVYAVSVWIMTYLPSLWRL